MDAEKERLAAVRVRGNDAFAAEVASISEQQVPEAGATLEELLRRPHVHYGCAPQGVPVGCPLHSGVGSSVQVRYGKSRVPLPGKAV